MLHSFDEAVSENLRLGEFLDSVEVAANDLEVGNEVWLYGIDGRWEAHPVVGFGQPSFNRIAVWAGRTD